MEKKNTSGAEATLPQHERCHETVCRFEGQSVVTLAANIAHIPTSCSKPLSDPGLATALSLHHQAES